MVSCVNVLRLAGVEATEEELVEFASTTPSAYDGRPLCDTGSPFADENGATSAGTRLEILQHYGVASFTAPPDVDAMAKYVEEGRGVIISVTNWGFYGIPVGGCHAVTVTSTRRGAGGQLLGFYICDSNGSPAQYYERDQLEDALSGRNMNVTTNVIR